MTNAAVIWGGLAAGVLFGAAGRLSGLCLLNGLRGWRHGGDGRHIRTFALALAVALLGSQALQAAGLFDLSQSIYVRAPFSPLLVFIGGGLFGIGMVMANGCGARALVLLGSGNLRALIVLMWIAVGGYVALTGVLAPLRVAAGQVLAMQIDDATIPGLLTKLGFAKAAATWLTVTVAVVALCWFTFGHVPFRRDFRLLAGGAAAGCAIVAGWVVTGALGADDFDPTPVASASFIAPVGDSLLYLMLATGKKINFGVALVAGVVLGSFLLAVARGDLKLEGFATPQIMARAMAGGLLMGIGGALAAGCSIGHGLSGLSALALMSIPASAGILAGAWIALRTRSANPTTTKNMATQNP
jgi:uncharacterized membrane protein YedE/YeeE